MRRREFLASSTSMAAIAGVATSTNPSVDASSKAEPHTFKLNYSPASPKSLKVNIISWINPELLKIDIIDIIKTLVMSYMKHYRPVWHHPSRNNCGPTRKQQRNVLNSVGSWLQCYHWKNQMNYFENKKGRNCKSLVNNNKQMRRLTQIPIHFSGWNNLLL